MSRDKNNDKNKENLCSRIPVTVLLIAEKRLSLGL